MRANCNYYIMESSKAMILLQKKLLGICQGIKPIKENNQCQQQGCQKQDQKNSLTISYMVIQKFSPKIKSILQQKFNSMINITINNCDLRTFENFPRIQNLKSLDASKNSLRGSFQFLVKNRSLKYINVSSNMISDLKKFQPLKCLKNLNVYVKDNPFESKNTEENGQSHTKNFILQHFKDLGLNYLQNPISKNVVKKQPKKQQKQQMHQSNLSESSSNKQVIQKRIAKHSNAIRKYLVENLMGQIQINNERFSQRLQKEQNLSLNLRQSTELKNAEENRTVQQLLGLRRERSSISRAQQRQSEQFNPMLQIEQFQNFLNQHSLDQLEVGENEQQEEEELNHEIQIFQNIPQRHIGRLNQLRRRYTNQASQIQFFGNEPEEDDSDQQQNQQRQQESQEQQEH